MTSFRIARQFNGPPQIGNGGYSAGLFARAIGAQVTVRLRRPLPLETDIEVRGAESGHEAHAGGELLASAQSAVLPLSAPPAPSWSEACAAASHYVGLGSEVYAGYTHCFVCGASRGVGDGLRIFPGKLPDRELLAAPFDATPFASADGLLSSELIWAALDCPGYFATFPDNRFALLGELNVRIDRPVRAAEKLVVVGWPIDLDGRKRRAGTALYDEEGRPCAVGQATWIEVKQA